jgi:hypothetical protein
MIPESQNCGIALVSVIHDSRGDSKGRRTSGHHVISTAERNQNEATLAIGARSNIQFSKKGEMHIPTNLHDPCILWRRRHAALNRRVLLGPCYILGARYLRNACPYCKAGSNCT